MAKSKGIGLDLPKPTIDRYQTEDDLRTLHRAHEITSDRQRHGAVKKLAASQLKAVMKPKR